MQLTRIFFSGLLASILLIGVIVLTAKFHIHWSSGPKDAIQKIHNGNVPRIGGLGIFFGIWISVFAMGTEIINPLIITSVLAASVIFVIGFAEDISGVMKVSWRLILSFIPGAFIAMNSGIYLSHIGLAWVDFLLTLQFFSIGFTAFALSGLTHAFNMIDGVNGLVSFICLWVLGAYLVLGFRYEDTLIIQMSILLAAPIIGFLIFNWPWGKCFLGDGGAYLIGFFLAWIGVLLVERHEVISPFAPLVICSYPIIEALYSMQRRLIQGVSSGHPDTQHLHQLVKFRLIMPWIKRYGAGVLVINSATGFLLSLMCVPFIVLAACFDSKQIFLIFLFLLEYTLYSVLYQALNRVNVDDQIRIKIF